VINRKERREHKERENNMTDDHMRMIELVRETAYAIHVFHGNGYLEKVYENALSHRLRKIGFEVIQQKPITIRDEDGTIIGEYFADLVVNNSLVIELKACKAVHDEHRSQVLHYLKATGIEHGLLINFGSYRFEIQKFIRSAKGKVVPENQL
jgi:GxxExxY protein